MDSPPHVSSDFLGVFSTESGADNLDNPGDVPEQRIEGVDFRVKRAAGRGWEVLALSDRAARWLRANYRLGSPEGEDIIQTDLVGTNGFMRKARALGYRIAYIGPHSVNLF